MNSQGKYGFTTYRNAAKRLHAKEGELEFDDVPTVSPGEDNQGAYVQAWIWVSNDAITKEDRP